MLRLGRESQRVVSRPSFFTQLQDYFGSAIVYGRHVFEQLDIG